MTLDKIALTSKDSLPVIVAYNSLLYVTILLCVSLHIIFHFSDGDSHIIHSLRRFRFNILIYIFFPFPKLQPMYSNHVSLYKQLVTETRSGSTDAELSRDCIIHGVSSPRPPRTVWSSGRGAEPGTASRAGGLACRGEGKGVLG